MNLLLNEAQLMRIRNATELKKVIPNSFFHNISMSITHYI